MWSYPLNTESDLMSPAVTPHHAHLCRHPEKGVCSEFFVTSVCPVRRRDWQAAESAAARPSPPAYILFLGHLHPSVCVCEELMMWSGGLDGEGRCRRGLSVCVCLCVCSVVVFSVSWWRPDISGVKCFRVRPLHPKQRHSPSLCCFDAASTAAGFSVYKWDKFLNMMRTAC